MNDYVYVRELGSGHYGTINLYMNKKTNCMEAIKFLPRGEDTMTKHVLNEILILKQLSHPFVIGFNRVFLTDDHLCISMEYANGGDMYNMVVKDGVLEERTARYYFIQLILSVEYCHQKNIFHRDIKLENMLITKTSVGTFLKLCDFGMSKHDTGIHKSMIGTPAYIAPEILVNEEDGYDGKKADIWSCGVALYVMLFGRYPFDDPNEPKDPRKVLFKVRQGRFSFPPNDRVSIEACNLISRMLTKDPQHRITIEQIKSHLWLDEMKDSAFVDALPKYTRAYDQTTGQMQYIYEKARSHGVKLNDVIVEVEKELRLKLQHDGNIVMKVPPKVQMMSVS